MSLALVPYPQSVQHLPGPGHRLDGPVRISGHAATARLLAEALTEATGLPAAPAPDGPVVLEVRPGGPAESSVLTVDPSTVRVTGADPSGLFAATQTLVQLFTRDADGWSLPAVRILDAPRFAYRGLMLDVARHFHPPETVRAYLDRVAALKLNHLHLHLTDDQGWRLALAARPLITRAGSGTSVGGDPGGCYTAQDVADLIDYAAARHVTLVPEIDLPGHTHAVGLAHPELAADPVLAPSVLEVVGSHGGGLPTRGVPYTGMAVGFSSLRIGEPATDAFLRDVLAEVAALFPGPWLHVGGDEALGTDPVAYAALMARVTDLVADLGKTPIAWHDAGAAPGLHPGTVGQYWGHRTPRDGADEHARAFVARGGRLILSPADAVYLDMKPDADFPLGLTWAGTVDLRQAYRWDPAAVIDGVGEADVLGVEAALWTETARTLADLDALAYPRIAAAAEIAWSRPDGPERTWESFAARVAALAPLWTAQGVRLRPAHPAPAGTARHDDAPDGDAPR